MRQARYHLNAYTLLLLEFRKARIQRIIHRPTHQKNPQPASHSHPRRRHPMCSSSLPTTSGAGNSKTHSERLGDDAPPAPLTGIVLLVILPESSSVTGGIEGVSWRARRGRGGPRDLAWRGPRGGWGEWGGQVYFDENSLAGGATLLRGC